MVIPSLIQHKRDGGALRPAEWTELIGAYTAGEVPDYQMSALLMAIVWRGLEIMWTLIRTSGHGMWRNSHWQKVKP